MKPASSDSPPASKKRKPRTGVTRYDPEFAVLICERIATTPQSLVKICEAPDMPGIASIFRWVREHPEFREMYVMAKETQAEVLLEEALDLVDDDSNDLIHTPDGKIVFNRLAIQRCKMQVEHRRWIASKLLPRKYGTHPREKSPAAPPSPPSPAPTESSEPFDELPPGGIITEEYRMKLIAARRKVIEQNWAAVAAENAAAAAAAAAKGEAEKARNSTPTSPSSMTSSPPPDLQSPNSDPRHSTSRPQPPPPQGSPTGHNPRPMYDVPTPRRELSTMNKACS